MLKKHLKSRKGFTLIELIVVLGLLSLVLLVAFSILIFSNRTFRGANNQHNLQTDVRFALEAMTNDMRYATTLEIISSVDLDIDALFVQDAEGKYASISPYETYIFYNPAQESITKLRRDSSDMYELDTDAENPLEFTAIGSPQNRLEYALSGLNTDDSKEFDVVSQILMLNILDEDGDSKVTGTSGVAVKYMTPEDAVAELQYPTTQLIGDNDDMTVDITFNKTVRFSSFAVYPGASKDQLAAENVVVAPVTIGTEELTVSFVLVGTKPKSFVNNDEIALCVDYGTAFEYQAFYTLTYSGSAKKWTIE